MKYQQLGTFVIVTNEKMEFLLGQRKGSFKAGLYGCPGGHLEGNELLDQCAQRELEEETGITATQLQFVGVIREWQGEYTFVHFAFTLPHYSGKIQLKEPEKCQGWRFFALKDLPAATLPAHLAGIELVANNSAEKLVDLV